MSMIKTSLVLFLLLVLPACFGGRIHWREIDTPPRAFQDVWTSILTAAERGGYDKDAATTDRGLRVFQSKWVNRVASGFGRSKRTRMRVEVERLGELSFAVAQWQIRFHVARQNVPDMSRGMAPQEEDWEDNGQEVLAEDLFDNKLRWELGATPQPTKIESGLARGLE